MRQYTKGANENLICRTVGKAYLPKYYFAAKFPRKKNTPDGPYTTYSVLVCLVSFKEFHGRFWNIYKDTKSKCIKQTRHKQRSYTYNRIIPARDADGK